MASLVGLGDSMKVFKVVNYHDNDSAIFTILIVILPSVDTLRWPGRPTYHTHTARLTL